MIETEQHEGVVVLRLVHGKANALDTELCAAIVDRFRSLADMGDPVVLIGTGKIFSGGVDLLRLLADGAPYARQLVPALSSLFHTVAFHPAPVVAAINGHAIAGGCVLACCADYRLMASGSCKIGVAELLVGVPFPPEPLEVMRDVVAHHRFAEVIYGGGRYLPDGARELGMVDEVVEPDALVDVAVVRARSMGRIPSRTFRLTKAQLRHPMQIRIDEGKREFGQRVAACWEADEIHQFVRGYAKQTLSK